MEIVNAPIDLGASLNSIPLSMVDRFGYLQVKPYVGDLQMAYKTCRKRMGAVNDMLIQVYNHTFPIDFVISDVKEDQKIPLILGRPFIKTARMLVDMD